MKSNTNSLQTNIISMFAAAILAAVIAVAVASILIANRIDALTQNQQPAAQLAHAVTPAASTTVDAVSCDVPESAGGGGAGTVLSAVTTPVAHKTATHTHHTHTKTHTTTTNTNNNTGNTGNTGVVNVPVNVSGNSILNDNLNDNTVLSGNEVNVLNDNTVDTDIPVLNFVGNQVGPTGILGLL